MKKYLFGAALSLGIFISPVVANASVPFLQSSPSIAVSGNSVTVSGTFGSGAAIGGKLFYILDLSCANANQEVAVDCWKNSEGRKVDVAGITPVPGQSFSFTFTKPTGPHSLWVGSKLVVSEPSVTGAKVAISGSYSLSGSSASSGTTPPAGIGYGCGSAYGVPSATEPSSNLCTGPTNATGYVSSGDTTWNWSCYSSYDAWNCNEGFYCTSLGRNGTSVACKAPRITTVTAETTSLDLTTATQATSGTQTTGLTAEKATSIVSLVQECLKVSACENMTANNLITSFSDATVDQADRLIDLVKINTLAQPGIPASTFVPVFVAFTANNDGSFVGSLQQLTTTATLPDLTAGTVSVTPGTASIVNFRTRQNETFSATVSNATGAGAALNFPNIFEIVDSAYASPAFVSAGTVSSLSAGNSVSIGASQLLYDGSYYVRACTNRDISGKFIIAEQPSATIASNCGTWKSFTVSAIPATVNGACGYTPDSYLSSPSAVDLCAKGTASSVTTGTANYSWTCSGSNGGATVSCSAKVIGAFSFSPSSLNFNYTQGSSAPASQTVTITNTSTSNVTYTVNLPSPLPSWLTTSYVAPAWSPTTYGSSVAYANSSSGLTISVNPAGLAPGTYMSNILFVGNFAGYSKTIPITLTVTAPATASPTGTWSYPSPCPTACGTAASTQTQICTGGNGTCSGSATSRSCTATAACVAPTATTPTLDFTMSDSMGNNNVTATSAATPPSMTITIPEPVIPRWTSTNATSCTASGGWTGSKAINNTTGEYLYPQVTTTYTLSCSNSAGTVTKSVKVVPVAQTYDYGSEAYAPRSPQTASVMDALFSASNATSGATFGYQWNNDLQIGSSNVADVGALQIALTKEGVYKGEITGGFYNQTFGAVKAFQQKYNIETTGFVGPQTRAKLNTLYAK